MLKLDITHDAHKFLKKLPPKQYRQVVSKMLSLMKDPKPHDTKQLIGFPEYWRTDIGEYRIVYKFSEDLVKIEIIGKRNDSDVYRQFRGKSGLVQK